MHISTIVVLSIVCWAVRQGDCIECWENVHGKPEALVECSGRDNMCIWVGSQLAKTLALNSRSVLGNLNMLA